MDECYDKVRVALSDETGELRFTDFDIINAPECGKLAEELRSKLLGQQLADIDVVEIQKMSCPGNGQCMEAIVNIIAEYQDRFLHTHRHDKPKIAGVKEV